MPCNHPIVKLNTQEIDGTLSHWWACDFCHALFIPQLAQTRPLTIRQLAEEIKDYASPKTPETFAAQLVNIEGIVDKILAPTPGERAASGSGTPATPSAPDADERLRIISEEKEEFRQDCIALSAQLKAALKEIEREREACAKLADGDKCGRTAEAIRSRASQPGPAQSTGGKTK